MSMAGLGWKCQIPDLQCQMIEVLSRYHATNLAEFVPFGSGNRYAVRCDDCKDECVSAEAAGSG